MRPTVLLGIIAVSALPMAPAKTADAMPSEECSRPCLEYESTFGLNGAWVHPDDGAIGDSYLLDPKSENYFDLKATDGLSFIANFISEPVIDAEPGKNQIFSGTGTYVDDL